jgi:hypothetical protein
MTRMILEGLFVVAVILVVGSTATNMIILLPQSRKYRTDLRPGQRTGEGRFPFWQLNVLSSENYNSPKGRKFHRKLMLVNYIQWAGIMLGFTCLAILGSM